MLDQSFSAENFRKIFDSENRKGHYLERKFFPEIAEITEKIQKLSPNSKKGNRFNLRNEKEKLLMQKLEEISAQISEEKIKIKLKEIDVGGKKVYETEKTATIYFILKQIQYNIKKLYQIRQNNRNIVLSQLRELLNNEFPKYVIYRDIKEFFEKIPLDRLREKIDREPLLAFESKKAIRKILEEYTRVSRRANGVPRGISISPYLAELYMQDTDKFIFSHSNVIFYARYVDDMIIICNSTIDMGISAVAEEIDEIIEKNGLNINLSKSHEFDLTKANETHELEYLGYRINFGLKDKVEFKLSQSKIERYKDRLLASFDAYKRSSKLSSEKKARKILVKRIKFLTSNTRLLSYKKSAIVGIYFSNSLLDSNSELLILDNYLNDKIQELLYEPVRNRLRKMSFREGFNQKLFTRFSESELSQIVKIWKHVR